MILRPDVDVGDGRRAAIPPPRDRFVGRVTREKRPRPVFRPRGRPRRKPAAQNGAAARPSGPRCRLRGPSCGAARQSVGQMRRRHSAAARVEGVRPVPHGHRSSNASHPNRPPRASLSSPTVLKESCRWSDQARPAESVARMPIILEKATKVLLAPFEPGRNSGSTRLARYRIFADVRRS